MNIPNNIKIGGQTYNVIKKKKILDTSGNVLARIDYNDNTIEVQENSSKEGMDRAFLHEVIHAINDFTGLRLAEYPPKEEDVDRLANALYMVIKDNPNMFVSNLACGGFEINEAFKKALKETPITALVRGD